MFELFEQVAEIVGVIVICAMIVIMATVAVIRMIEK